MAPLKFSQRRAQPTHELIIGAALQLSVIEAVMSVAKSVIFLSAPRAPNQSTNCDRLSGARRTHAQRAA